MTEPTGSWMETFTGKKFFPLDPQIESINLMDISHALSLICRYGGHSSFHYSVAQHCVLLHDSIPEHKDMALFHDASEAYLCDIPSPLKPHLTNYKEIEHHLQSMIYRHFGMPEVEPPIVKEYDTRIIIDEKKVLFPQSPHTWIEHGEALGVTIEPWTPERARDEYFHRGKMYIR